ncbi:hypothetical protein C0991_000747 [Blastosporella zonata]|nr:hypothetical protein C0991_000747 [Blastosporella zonata]
MPIVTQPSGIAGDHASHFESQPPPAPPLSPTCGRTSRMTRGRKKDLTIPPTRALVQQRDYRARRAQYVSDLEERVRKAEEENAKLRHELAAARTGHAVVEPLSLDSQTVCSLVRFPADKLTTLQAHASSELLHSLSIASASLARFQQLAFPEPRHASQDSRQSTNHPLTRYSGNAATALRRASFPSPAPSPPYTYPISESSSSHHHNLPRRKRLYREDSPEPVVSPSDDGDNRSDSTASSPISDCRGGIPDCRNLIKHVDSGAMVDLESPRPRSRHHTDSPHFSHSVRHDAQRY